MPGKSNIEWTDATWNPVVGCTRVSAGCDHCYAETLHNQRHAAYLKTGAFGNIPQYHQPFEVVQTIPARLDIPIKWTKPRRIFVNSVSDLFHADVPDAFIAEVFATMALADHHIFQVLTKRPRRMQQLLNSEAFRSDVIGYANDRISRSQASSPRLFRRFQQPEDPIDPQCNEMPWPLPNVWLGTSVENQEAAYRIDYLVQTPAAVRFLSCEPLLGFLYLSDWLWSRPAGSTAGPFYDKFGNHRGGSGGFGGQAITSMRLNDLHWVIVGGESGKDHREMEPHWVRSLRDQCEDAGVPFFFKQWGGLTPKSGGRELDGRTWDEMPETAMEAIG